MATLVDEGLIKTATTKGQMMFRALLPEDVCEKIDHPLPHRRSTKSWCGRQPDGQMPAISSMSVSMASGLRRMRPNVS